MEPPPVYKRTEQIPITGLAVPDRPTTASRAGHGGIAIVTGQIDHNRHRSVGADVARASPLPVASAQSLTIILKDQYYDGSDHGAIRLGGLNRKPHMDFYGSSAVIFITKSRSLNLSAAFLACGSGLRPLSMAFEIA